MANMAYVRFQNTQTYLEDCFDHMMDEGLSSSEESARKHVIELCVEIADQFKIELDTD